MGNVQGWLEVSVSRSIDLFREELEQIFGGKLIDNVLGRSCPAGRSNAAERERAVAVRWSRW